MADPLAISNHRARIHAWLNETPWLHGLAYAAGFAVLTALLAHVRVYAPWNPYVPYTGQVFGVLSTGLFLGPLTGLVSMVFYLGLGALGLPVFQGGNAGIAYMLGGTGGYLFSYPLAAAATGWLSRRYLQEPTDRTLAKLAGLALGGFALLFGLGAGLMGLTGVLATDGLGLTVLVSSALIAGVAALLWWWSRRESTAFLARLFCGLVGVVVIYALGFVVLKLVTGMTWTAAVANGVIQFVPVDLAKAFVAAGAAGALLPPVEPR